MGEPLTALAANGPAWTLVAVGMYGVWLAMRYIANEVAKPLVFSAVEHMRAVERANDANAETLRLIAETLRESQVRNAETQETNAKALTQLADTARHHQTLLERLVAMLSSFGGSPS